MPSRRPCASPAQGQIPLPEFERPWETRGIFSEHYIQTKLRQSDLWPHENEVTPVMQLCSQLWNRLSVTLGKKNEAFTRQEFLDKVLTGLGFAFLPNTALPLSSARKEPDYLLFADEASKESVIGSDAATQYAAAAGLLEAKKVNHPLDSVSKKETPGRFPHQQVRDYLQYATDHVGKPYFRWAILTNGNLWRLYCRDAKPDDYFEMDITTALRSLDEFSVFVALFRPAAFVRDTDGRCALDDIRSEALHYQSALEDDLRKRVFVILTRLANGFYSRRENNVRPSDGRLLYESCLVFLYRLLFILYAEGRGLLPVKPSGTGANSNYRERYSLRRLLSRLRSPQQFASDDFPELYESLLALFHLINGDQPARNRACDVPLYNGGLFDPKRYPQLERWRIGEKTLADVLRALAFANVPVASGEQESLDFGNTIDYADLQVRQLGSIYEGLLEKHLELVGETFVLVGDKTERKATGTYYTPDHVVRYIVDKSLAPLCAGVEDSDTVKQAVAKGVKDNCFANAVLALTVLDPAMGSGHFLVRATEFIADKIINHPTTALHTTKISRGLSQAEVELSFWRRRVVEQCIFGVDLNPLAVELAKLSLWLTCIATDQPLSFLDHHLTPGDSLTGAWLDDLGELPRLTRSTQPSLPFAPDLTQVVGEAIRAIRAIEQTESTDIPSVKRKELSLRENVRAKIEPYRTVADVWTSTFFGYKANEGKYQRLTKLIAEAPKPRSAAAKELKRLRDELRAVLADARKVRRFCHWELEFPEAFFDENGRRLRNPGFDAVVGNPPYDVVAEGAYEERSVANGTGNLFGHFIARAMQLSKRDGTFGFVVPLSYSCGADCESLRRAMYSRYGSLEATHFSIRPASIFPGVDQRVTIFVASGKPDGGCRVASSRLYRFRDGEQERLVLNPELGEVSAVLKGFIPRVANETGAGIYRKFNAVRTRLADLVDPMKKSDARWWFHSVGRYWLKAYDFLPHFLRGGKPAVSSDTFEVLARNAKVIPACVAVVNSSLFYFWWILQSDEFHVLRSQVCSGKTGTLPIFPADVKIIDTAQGILDLRFWIAETADGSRLTAYGLGRSSFFRTSYIVVGRSGSCQTARSRRDRVWCDER